MAVARALVDAANVRGELEYALYMHWQLLHTCGAFANRPSPRACTSYHSFGTML